MLRLSKTVNGQKHKAGSQDPNYHRMEFENTLSHNHALEAEAQR
jgi:hypothetical protein